MAWVWAALIGAIVGGISGGITAHIEWPKRQQKPEPVEDEQ